MALAPVIASAGTLPLELDGTAIDPELEKQAEARENKDHAGMFVGSVGAGGASPSEFSSSSESSSSSINVGLGFGEAGGPGTPFITNQRFEYPFPDPHHSPTEDRLLSLAARPTLPSSVSTESSSSSSSQPSADTNAGASSSSPSHSPVQTTHGLPISIPSALSPPKSTGSIPNPLLTHPLIQPSPPPPPTAVAFSLSSPPSSRLPQSQAQPQHPLLRTQTPPVPPALKRRLQRSKSKLNRSSTDEDVRSESAASDEAAEADVEDEVSSSDNTHDDAHVHARGVASTTTVQDFKLAVLFVGVLLALHSSGKVVSWIYALVLSAFS
ncbi:hypothetical protein CONPUDRAFT_165261 [Coniophora puteana RWD-64-598 SS2]|uniref:Uncharacterized protein n=1 Tax=Coniophora puteana (strain RWD-64-598) TaxID=741705 RepID=A0A5M3MR78_CONPW|nr:uncharacterized protein CONPUDRAFT_165261 [Coniophora puteana RWD-64-598 SS2]EIW81031.1 hypothetical protein CONPUDRAFT_165261 [Coniophora puteana RWD-64-598 SS2]